MLGFMRRHAQSAAIKIIFWLIIIVFVFWGVGAMVGGGDRVNVAAMVDGEPIPAEAYTRAVSNMQRVYQQLYRENFNPALAAQLNLQQRAIDDLVTDLLLKREANRLGLQVTDDEVRDAILAIPAFQNGGRFERNQYVAALRASQMNPTQFEESQRETLLITKLENLLTDGVYVTDAEVRDLYAIENEKIDVAFVRIPFAKFHAGITVTDQEIADYYEQNQERFRQPDRVTLTYVPYTVESFAETLPIDDEAVQAYYDGHMSDYELPEAPRVSRILFSVPAGADDAAKAATKAKAEDVLGALKDGGDFAALAKEHSGDVLTADAGGDLGIVERGKLEGPVEQVVFSLEPGQLSDVIETTQGFEILKVTEMKPAGTKPLADVRDEIVTILRKNGADDAARAALEADAEKARGGTSLEDLATARQLKATTTPSIGRGKFIPGVKGSALLDGALNLEVGEIGELAGVEPPYYLFKVGEKIPTAIPPLADVREQIVTIIRDDKAKAAAVAEGEQILAAAKGGKVDGLAALATARGLTVDETGPFGRSDALPKLAPAPIKEQLFALSETAPFGAKPYDVADGVVVVALKERVLPDDAGLTDEKRTSLRDGAMARRRQDVLESYRNMLRQRADISINPNVVTDLAG